MRDVTIVVPGVPVAQPRQRHRIIAGANASFVQNYTPGRHPVQGFKQMIQLAVRLELMRAECVGPFRGPVRIDWTAVFPRPKGKIWKRRPMPRYPHTAKPDRDNLDKAILDALKGVVLVDDAQVCCGTVEKFVAAGDEQPHVVIRIQELE